MKTDTSNVSGACMTNRAGKGFRARFRRTLAVALTVLSAFTVVAQAQPRSPVGTWDCLIGGSQNGLAYLTFSGDNGGTVEGYQILVPRLRLSTISPNRFSLVQTIPTAATTNVSLVGTIPASPGVDLYLALKALQGGTLLASTPTVSRIHLYGYFPVAGRWGFDSRGRVIGFFNELADNSASGDGSDTLTNTVNFTGIVVPGRRLTLMSRTPLGIVTWRGIPASDTLADLSGEWYGVKGQSGRRSFEFFTLTPSEVLPNIYYVDNGEGAAYTYSGIAILSARRQLAMAVDVGSSDAYQSTRAVMGPFGARSFSASMSGIDAAPGTLSLSNRVSFKAVRTSAAGPVAE